MLYSTLGKSFLGTFSTDVIPKCDTGYDEVPDVTQTEFHYNKCGTSGPSREKNQEKFQEIGTLAVPKTVPFYRSIFMGIDWIGPFESYC
ncbi:hypothetical protein JTE90_029398 [Oedothorax gibbosus]|uniref:Uncharacterized protein n=1 Tax=Oedothorax gibbosus TaxID=931172 RepID=A0AAV6UBN4_9ARAC|nr:hypothetical protein JTE90_029398 [Oedothorax gibbosus]